MNDRTHPLSLTRQSAALGISRGAAYYPGSTGCRNSVWFVGLYERAQIFGRGTPAEHLARAGVECEGDGRECGSAVNA